MTRPSAQVLRKRRRACLYTPALALGAAMLLAAFPTFNSAYLLGIIFLTVGAGGFVLETGTTK
jgi:hypothetical protein